MFMLVDPFVRQNLYAFTSLEENLQKATKLPVESFYSKVKDGSGRSLMYDSWFSISYVCISRSMGPKKKKLSLAHTSWG